MKNDSILKKLCSVIKKPPTTSGVMSYKKGISGTRHQKSPKESQRMACIKELAAKNTSYSAISGDGYGSGYGFKDGNGYGAGYGSGSGAGIGCGAGHSDGSGYG